MTDEPTPQSGLPDLPRRIALLVLAGASGTVVWAFHAADWPVFLTTLALGGLLGFLAGGLVGVHLPHTLAAMLVFGGLFEGAYQGWCRGGWAGAAVGGPAGVLGGVFAVWLSLMLLHLALILCGVDPLAHLDRPEEAEGRAP